MGQLVAELFAFLRREHIFRLMGVILALALIGAAGLTYFEEDRPFEDALWWAVVTLTTVGYGDISPESLGGRLLAVVMMLFGIGVLGIFTATIAGVFVEQRMRKDRGMGAHDLAGHIILCGWNGRTKEILADLRADARTADRRIALVADIEAKPVDDDRLDFVRGTETEDDLRRACIHRAETVVLVGDRALEHGPRDAKAVLGVLTVKSLNRDVYTIVELASEKNVRHCKQAGANEIIVASDLCSRVISTATLDHGISTVLRELLSAQEGHTLITMAAPTGHGGRPFFEVFSDLKRRQGVIALAIQRHGNGDILTNPAADVTVEANDRLVVIAGHAGGGGGQAAARNGRTSGPAQS